MCARYSFPSRWLVYNQKVKSSDIFIRDSSCVSDYALLLFGGALSTQVRASSHP
jgi:ATP-dependent RNA helicase DHX36